MAYLNPLRLTFAGTFQADVSTVNNDVRHYDNASFQPSYQQLATKEAPNGWWNPAGSGAFLLRCRITSVGYADGTVATDAAHDPCIGLTVTGAGDRTAGKLVDIDPQWQLASAPWGLGVRVLAGNVELLSGEYASNAFRDLWFTRDRDAVNDGAASATFQSVLTEVHFSGHESVHSRALRELAETTEGGRLSIRLTTFGYDGDSGSPRFTLGAMVGTIGPCFAGEPESFVLGRRFAPAAGFQSYGAGVTYFSGLLDKASSTLLLDLSNALQSTNAHGKPNDIGRLSVGILADDAVVENTPVSADNLWPLGEVHYKRTGWLADTGGVVAMPLDAQQYKRAASHPLALVYEEPSNPGTSGEGDGMGVVAIRETVGGLLVEAEPAVVRLDAGQSATVSVYAARLGALLDAEVVLRQVGRVPAQGGGPDSEPGVPIPDMGFPESALEFPRSVTTVDGATTVELRAGDPGNPRGYLDGQVYLVDCRLPGQSNTSRQPFDFLVVHVRDDCEVPAEPTWDDVGPILTQYSNLYPIMSIGFIDLADEAAVRVNREILSLAFSTPITDPNHMPVTRDLSGPKRRMLLAWLASIDPDGSVTVPGHRPATVPTTAAPSSTPQTASDSKTRFADSFRSGGRNRPNS